MDGIPKGVSDCLSNQVVTEPPAAGVKACGAQALLSRTIALRITMSLRITAIKAALGTFPASRKR
jgi:hypothetical protein